MSHLTLLMYLAFIPQVAVNDEVTAATCISLVFELMGCLVCFVNVLMSVDLTMLL